MVNFVVGRVVARLRPGRADFLECRLVMTRPPVIAVAPLAITWLGVHIASNVLDSADRFTAVYMDYNP